MGTCATTYSETPIPTTAFPGVTIFAFWDDLFLYTNTSQGIYYAVQGNAPNRSLVFEYYTTHFGQVTQYYRFQVIFFEGVPGVVQYKYFDASDGGISCAVGIQGKKIHTLLYLYRMFFFSSSSFQYGSIHSVLL